MRACAHRHVLGACLARRGDVSSICRVLQVRSLTPLLLRCCYNCNWGIMFHRQDGSKGRCSAACAAFRSMWWVRRRRRMRERARIAAHLRNTPKLGIAFDYFDAMFFFADYIGSFLLFLYACCGPDGPVDRRLSYLLALFMCVMYAIREALEFFKHLDEDNASHECVYYYPKLYLLSLGAIFFLSLSAALYILNFKDGPHDANVYCAIAVVLIVLYGPGSVLRIHFFVSSLEGSGQGLVSRYYAMRNWIGNIAAHARMGHLEEEQSALLDYAESCGQHPCADAPFSHVTQIRQNPRLFLSLWHNVIKPEILGLIMEDGVECDDLAAARDTIYAAYLDFNSYCKAAYFQNEEAQIDRHQMSACLTYAVLVARPMTINPASASERSYYANERLAVTLGCSTMVTFLLQYYADRLAKQDVDRAERSKMEAARDKMKHNGIALPRIVPNEDTYTMTLYRCLRFTAAEGSFNILGLASLYYLLENATVDQRLYCDMRAYYAARS